VRDNIPPAYGELAWTDTLLASPEECRREAEIYVRIIRENLGNKPGRILHLGCGAGMLDHTFKEHFSVTGVDISSGMLTLAGNLNPGIRYIQGDMRKVRVQESFDAVIVPDSIGYMLREEDVFGALETAAVHLREGGVLLITALLREDFRENNFVYTGSGGGVSVTLFENNFSRDPGFYEAVLLYLIRREGKLEVITDVHKQGLFSRGDWQGFLSGAGFKVSEILPLEDTLSGYRDNIIGEGEYTLTIFECLKTPPDRG